MIYPKPVIPKGPDRILIDLVGILPLHSERDDGAGQTGSEVSRLNDSGNLLHF